MNTNSELRPVLSRVEQGRVLSAFGDTLTVLVDGAQTGNRYAIMLNETPPGGGPPPHFHANEDESLHVLAGRVSFLVEGKWTEASVGATAFLPKGSIHTFKNIGDTPLRMLVSVSPAGFENFFAKCAAEFAQSSGPDMARIMAFAAEHGLNFVPP